MRSIALVLLLSACATSQVSKDGVDREAIRSSMQEHGSEIENCYKDRLKEKPDLQGSIAISFSLVAGGRAEKLRIKESETTIKDPALRSCILKKVSTWKFPEPPKGKTVDISYPWTFSLD